MEKNNAFDNGAEQYEKWFVENNLLLDSEVKAVKQLLPDSGEGIEIGVGTGVFASRLGIKHGVEPSKKMGKKAIKKGIEVINSFAEKLPIADETYDFALMVTVDCFLEDVMKAFRETWRIICKGGYLIIAFLDRETPAGKIYERKKNLSRFYQNANFHSAEEIEKYLEMTGFTVQEKKQTIYTLDNIPQEIKDGVGEGVFAVIKAKKRVH
jgi:ubiquinone/menaquinone biosynthesis C-methylase UbiE